MNYKWSTQPKDVELKAHMEKQSRLTRIFSEIVAKEEGLRGDGLLENIELLKGECGQF